MRISLGQEKKRTNVQWPIVFSNLRGDKKVEGCFHFRGQAVEREMGREMSTYEFGLFHCSWEPVDQESGCASLGFHGGFEEVHCY